ncbi:MAG: 30S ribosomal protein S7 [Patescibacteria group bacterium]|nr:MAG: 30S ribosomal protein S7 [Patescibacteria group bacterium]
MPRRSYKRIEIKPDPVYNSKTVAKLINYIMRDGKKSVAEKIVYTAFEEIKTKKLDPIEILEKAIENTAPEMEVRARRLGGASYLVPVPVRPTRKIFLSLNWIIDSASKKSNKQFKTFTEKLVDELLLAAKGEGGAVEKRQEVEKLVEANKAFAHLRW